LDETWKEVPGYQGYSASNIGRIRGPGKGKNGDRMMNPMKSVDGYLYIFTQRPNVPKKLFIHRAVLMAFVGPCPLGCESMHYPDANTENNRIDNLKWGTRQEQRADEIRRGKRIGESATSAKLTTNDVIAIRSLRGKISARKLSKQYAVSHTTILAAMNGDHWGHI